MEKESKERRVTGREKGNRKKDGGELDVSGRVLHLAIPLNRPNSPLRQFSDSPFGSLSGKWREVYLSSSIG